MDVVTVTRQRAGVSWLIKIVTGDSIHAEALECQRKPPAHGRVWNKCKAIVHPLRTVSVEFGHYGWYVLTLVMTIPEIFVTSCKAMSLPRSFGRAVSVCQIGIALYSDDNIIQPWDLSRGNLYRAF